MESVFGKLRRTVLCLKHISRYTTHTHLQRGQAGRTGPGRAPFLGCRLAAARTTDFKHCQEASTFRWAAGKCKVHSTAMVPMRAYHTTPCTYIPVVSITRKTTHPIFQADYHEKTRGAHTINSTKCWRLENLNRDLSTGESLGGCTLTRFRKTRLGIKIRGCVLSCALYTAVWCIMQDSFD